MRRYLGLDMPADRKWSVLGQDPREFWVGLVVAVVVVSGLSIALPDRLGWLAIVVALVAAKAAERVVRRRRPPEPRRR